MRARGRLVVVLVVTAALVVPVGPAAHAADGAITGRVTDAETGFPLAGICVSADSDSDYDSDLTDGAGFYRVGYLSPGAYAVRFYDCSYSGYLEEHYDDRPDSGSADAVEVRSGATTTGIDAGLTKGGTITGTVTDEGTGRPLPGICVYADGIEIDQYESDVSDEDGSYRLPGLRTGSYRVRFYDCSDSGYLDEYYDDGQFSDADPVEVLEGETIAGIDAALALGGVISGVVRADRTGQPLRDVCVDASSDGDYGYTCTRDDGTYRIQGLRGGSYRVEFSENSAGFEDEYYDDKPDWYSADLVEVVEGAEAGGIDAGLALDTGISGTVIDQFGTPVVGVCVGAHDEYGYFDQRASTGIDGSYLILFQPGTYHVWFDDCGSGDIFDLEWYDDASSSYEAEPVVVPEGADATGIDAQIEVRSSIGGTVTGEGGVPLSDACVAAYGDSRWDLEGYDYTDEDGTYRVGPLEPGEYRIEFEDCGTGEYLDGWYDGATSFDDADPVPVAEAEQVTAIDGQLSRGGVISGTVTDALRGGPIEDLCVYAYTPGYGWDFARWVRTASDGSYSVSRLSTGDHLIQFYDCEGDTYFGEWYDDASTDDEATRIPVVFGEETPGIDAALEPRCNLAWDGDAGTGRWADAANWEFDRVPTGADGVCVPSTSATVLVDSTAEAGELRSEGPVVVDGGDLTLGAGSSYLDGGLTLTDGTLRHDGRTFVEGAFTFGDGGTLTGDGWTTAFDTTLFLGEEVRRVDAGHQLEVYDAVFDGGWLCLDHGSELEILRSFFMTSGRIERCEGDLSSVLNWGYFIKGGSQTAIVGSSFMNWGDVLVEDGVLDLGAHLENWHPREQWLLYGGFAIAGTLRFSGADIVRNGAELSIVGPDAAIVDENGANGLRNLAVNEDVLSASDGGYIALPSGLTNLYLVRVGAEGEIVVQGDYVDTYRTELEDPTARLTVTGGRMTLAGGRLEGIGTVAGAVTNRGVVAPGDSPGTLTIEGEYVQEQGGVLQMEIEGTDPAEYDSLEVVGTVELGGTLDIRTRYYTPVDGDTFAAVSAVARTGEFASVKGTSLGLGRKYRVQYPPNGVSVVAYRSPVWTEDVTVAEGDSGTTNATFKISRASTTLPVIVEYGTADGTATAGEDYDQTAGTLTFAPGEAEKTVTVPVKGDELYETADETFILNLSMPNETLVLDERGYGTIRDDDPLPYVSIGDVSVTEGDEGATEAVFPVTLTNPSGVPVEVSYVTSGDTAYAPDDFAVTAGRLRFEPGETAATVSVPVAGDRVDEPDERFLVTLYAPEGVWIGDGWGSGTIRDDDDGPLVSVADATTVEGDGGTAPLDFTVTLDQPSAFDARVEYQTTDGTARSGADYAAAAGTVTFAPGETSRTVTVDVFGDEVLEDNETLALELSSPVNARIDRATGVGRIVDDDDPGVRIADLAVKEGDEGATAATVRVALAAPGRRDATIAYRTVDGSAVGGVDYEAATGTVEIPAGETSATVTVGILGDRAGEGAETFRVELSSPQNAVVDDADATVTIADDDTPIQYFALGDSIASGEGLPGASGDCEVAPGAYPSLVAAKLDPFFEVDLHLLACAGATAARSPSGNDLWSQVQDAVAARDPGVPGTASISIGWADLGLGTLGERQQVLCYATEGDFAAYLGGRLDAIADGLNEALGDLATRTDLSIVLTQLFQPFNRYPSYLDDLVHTARPCDPTYPASGDHQAYERAGTIVTAVNALFLEVRDALPAGARDRVSIAPLRSLFEGHEAPRHPDCGAQDPLPTDSWIRFPVGSDPDYPGGDCVYPNDLGAAEIAAAVYQVAPLPEVPPVIDDVAPRSRFTRNPGDTVRRRGQVMGGSVSDDGAGVASLVVTITPAGGEAREVPVERECNFRRSLCTFTFTAPQDAGIYTVGARGTDSAGNVEPEPSSMTFVVV